MEKLNPFQLQLEEALRNTKETLVKQQETTQTAFESAEINRKSVLKDLEEARKNVERTHADYFNLKQINSRAQQASLVGKNIVAIGAINAKDAGSVVTTIAKAAKSIELASQAIAKLYSDAASIHAKASSEDGNTEIEKMAIEASARSKEAANASEKTTISSLDATIAAAQCNSGAVQTILTTLSTDVDALSAATASTLQNAQTVMATADKAYADAIKSEKTSEQQISVTGVDFRSAKEVNGADKTRIGILTPEKEAPKKK
jgi:hypothetical protein